MKKSIFTLFIVISFFTTKAQVIISGMLVDPPGVDVTENESYEYIQFMATEEVNFSLTPYSVIIGGISGQVPTNKGWAAGFTGTNGTTYNDTYKINLTEGTVAAGEFFYVGGTSKVINGVGSQSMSAANWIKNINSNNTPGDDNIGKIMTEGLLPGGWANGAGLAVFNTTNVTQTTVPIDAVFWGGNIGRLNQTSTNVGYLIPDNDLYTPTAGKTTFGTEGNRTYVTSDPAVSVFKKFGGVYNMANQTWVTPRSGTNITLTNTSTLADIETGAGVTVLPVKLTSFSAKTVNTKIELSWTTASEQSNSHFEILRSDDGITFHKIGQINGKGDSNTKTTYSFNDNAPANGINYYQLNQVDFNGESVSSTVISANANFQKQQFSIISTANNTFTAAVDALKKGNATLRITNLSGQVLLNTTVYLEKGHNQFDISTPYLSTGIYVASITTANKEGQSIKFKK